MIEDKGVIESETIVASIANKEDPAQVVDIRYVREENAFVTSGIKQHFDEREILIPAYLVIKDLGLMGAIVSTILEKLSQALDREGSFEYASRLDALDKTYSVEKYGDYMRLSEGGV